MTRGTQIAIHGVKNNSKHDQDWFEIEDAIGPAAVIAVADGVSESRSHGAARFVVQMALDCYRSNPAQQWGDYYNILLRRINSGSEYDSLNILGKTTLTVVWIEPQPDSCAVARYLAIGDSPIYIAHRGPVMDLYPDTFLVQSVHTKPLLVQNHARIYSYVDCDQGLVVGRIASGSVELRPDDICLVCTDGVPLKSAIVDDLNIGKTSHRFLNNVYSRGPKQATENLFRTIAMEGGFSDDATLVTILIGTAAQKKRDTLGAEKRSRGATDVAYVVDQASLTAAKDLAKPAVGESEQHTSTKLVEEVSDISTESEGVERHDVPEGLERLIENTAASNSAGYSTNGPESTATDGSTISSGLADTATPVTVLVGEAASRIGDALPTVEPRLDELAEAGVNDHPSRIAVEDSTQPEASSSGESQLDSSNIPAVDEIDEGSREQQGVGGQDVSAGAGGPFQNAAGGGSPIPTIVEAPATVAAGNSTKSDSSDPDLSDG